MKFSIVTMLIILLPVMTQQFDVKEVVCGRTSGNAILNALVRSMTSHSPNDVRLYLNYVYLNTLKNIDIYFEARLRHV